MSENPKLFEQYHNDMIETGRFFVSTDITLRDLFAAAALSGMCANNENGGTFSAFAKDAYDYADALLAQRSDEEK